MKYKKTIKVASFIVLLTITLYSYQLNIYVNLKSGIIRKDTHLFGVVVKESIIETTVSKYSNMTSSRGDWVIVSSYDVLDKYSPAYKFHGLDSEIRLMSRFLEGSPVKDSIKKEVAEDFILSFQHYDKSSLTAAYMEKLKLTIPYENKMNVQANHSSEDAKEK